MLTLVEAAEQIRTRKISPVELTQQCLDRIERLNPTLNAFITISASARRAAFPSASKICSTPPAFRPQPPAINIASAFQRKMPKLCEG